MPDTSAGARRDGATAPAPHDGASRRIVDGRRDFLRAAGLAGVTLSVGGLLAACTADGVTVPDGGAPRPATVDGGPGRYNITLDFSNEIDVLNYAYALEQLEAAFYVQVVTNAAFTSVFAANEQRILRDLRDHEVTHRVFLAAALGTARIPALTPNFASIDFASRASVLQAAQTFEDLGVGAYNGAGRYLRNPDFLTVAGKIVSVEARHASAIRATRNGDRTASFAPDAFDPALPPATVLTSAAPFLQDTITVVNA
jgi:hypothetical protein